VVSKSLTAFVQVQLLFGKFVVIKNRLNYLFVNYHFNDWFVKSLKISKQIFDFNHQLLWLYKKRVNHT